MGHAMLMREGQREVGNDPHALFDYLYNSMAAVMSFGRTGRFDISSLTMLGKLRFGALKGKFASRCSLSASRLCHLLLSVLSLTKRRWFFALY